MTIVNTVSLSVDQAIQAAIKVMSAGYAVYFHGKPGIGKTEAFRDLAESQGFGFEAVYLGQKQAGDAAGLPMIDREKGVTLWTLPDFIASIPDDRIHILLFDELSAATPDVQVCAYQILQDRKLRDYELPDNVWLAGAGNRPEDGAIAYEMGTALADRLCHFNVKADIVSTLNYAERKG